MNTITIAEIGCNHMGDLNFAKSMIDALATMNPKVDYVKFQKRRSLKGINPSWYNAPHPVPNNSFGKSYGEHRDFLEFSMAEHRSLFEYCSNRGIAYACSAWDLHSAKEIYTLGADYIKIPSACNQDWEMLDWLIQSTQIPLHISLGMLSHKEIEQLHQYILRLNAEKRVIFYHCTSDYPVADEDISLLEIPYLINQYSEQLLGIGFSGHHLGVTPDCAALALGARWIERHFTLDKSLKGTDHSSSLDPSEMQLLLKSIESVSKSLSIKSLITLNKEKSYRPKLTPNFTSQNDRH